MKKDEREPLAGKIAVVTGASRGIGLAIAQALGEAGCDVVAASRNLSRSHARTESRRPRADSRQPIEIRCDVRDEGQVALLFAKVREQFGRLDILVNNAGTAHALRKIEDLPLETWREVLDTNLTGTFLCTQAALPLMGKGGVIVNNLSVAARGVFPGESAYCASKYGALGFTETLREEVRERGSRGVSLLPGPTATDIWSQFMPNAPRSKMMSPETVAKAVLSAIAIPDNAAVEELRIAPVTGRF